MVQKKMAQKITCKFILNSNKQNGAHFLVLFISAVSRRLRGNALWYDRGLRLSSETNTKKVNQFNRFKMHMYLKQ